ncbi:hypothetical protein [Nostoc commune]|uniref:hypothetical protein n=1 Tax=Nostoc commune TaxID=1178 RepID=UPI002072ADFC|nr:hypothetical protein [Nostoc commune]
MEQVLTLVCKLNPSQRQAEEIELVLKAFADACNYANEKVTAPTAVMRYSSSN